MADLPDPGPLLRWRLVLGEAAQDSLGTGCSEGWLKADTALDWLYNRGTEGASRSTERQGGDGASVLTVPEWVNEIHELFPQSTIERLEKDAVERYHLTEIVTNPEVLERVEPNPALLKAVLQTKHLMNPQTLELAKRLVRKVVAELMDKLKAEIKRSFSGTPSRHTRSPLKVARNFDPKRSIRDNIRHFDVQRRKIVVRRPFFFSRSRRDRVRWQFILVVDQSGSMLDSTIHAAVTAACFWGLPSIRTHLVAFDTEVVDLTSDVSDPVELLMKVQLGGGTDIARAMDYAASLVDNPRRAIVVLLTDFYEGGNPSRLVSTTRALCQQGTTVLGLAALDQQANPVYDRQLAGRLAEEGAHIGAMTPDQLAAFIADVMA